jgi:predicted ABC-type ATPase
VSRKKLDRPKFWIVAGPNGSGKSSIYTDTDIDDFGGSVWIINPDLLTARIQEIEHLKPRAANIAAVTRIYSWLEASIAAHQTIGVETVLSTEKYRALVLAAKAHGFEVRLIYILLSSPELAVERVKLRVGKGGHHVPATKIRQRRVRSLKQLLNSCHGSSRIRTLHGYLTIRAPSPHRLRERSEIRLSSILRRFPRSRKRSV